MLITSPSFKDGENIPKKFTCDGSTSLNRVGSASLDVARDKSLTTGGGMNPELHIENVPPGTQGLALIMDDPDATRGGTFTHWLVWNIDPGTKIIKEESVPPGAVEGVNDFGNIGYGGPCPPRGANPHHYQFKLYALDGILKLSKGAAKDALGAEIGKHLVAKAELVGLYQRQ